MTFFRRPSRTYLETRLVLRTVTIIISGKTTLSFLTMTVEHANDSVSSCPATEALKQAQQDMELARSEKQRNFEKSLSSELFSLTFDKDISSFPSIAWDSEEESDSNESIKSLDVTLLGKRGREESKTERRLVRSRKFKSNLADLVLTIATSS